MGYISEEILRTNIPCSILSEAEAMRYRLAFESAFGSTRWPLWEHIDNTVYKQDVDAWRWMRDFLGAEPGYLFFNPDNDKDIVQFEHAKTIVDVIADCFLFEFYISDKNQTYFLCFNHHDFLIAAGTAKPWLENRISTGEAEHNSDADNDLGKS